MIELIASASLGGIVGFFTCAMMTMSKVADADQAWQDENDFVNLVREKKDEALLAHARATDRGNTLQARIDRLKSIAASQQSVKSGRIVAVLEGDA